MAHNNLNDVTQKFATTSCVLQQLNDGNWWCPICDPRQKHTLQIRGQRNCPKAPSRGLGDTIAKMTRAVGLRPCGGCKKRQKKLNEWFPYQRAAT